ncbi:PLD nuclease N-terminal domain-containing protein [Agromyces seonyuensis]|uniref:Cardiolipin synthase N-terminal domain-containing protein n=1 Tax=Agromyces seonyuensis TaxID=2662446 RepID=A0A6I4P458_9MICO|nr:PLD nuclease N-terminal domain-containing protein [Agromyces seonyuensis]MWB98084.1 hypothetical protein [Agromyces seonyuensis]
MVRLWIVLGVALVVFTIYAIVDAALVERDRVRGLPRWAWILVILFVPLIGGVLWFVIGRGRRQKYRSGRGSGAPDDDPDFLRRLSSDRATEERIRRLEQELAELDEEPGDHGETGRPRRSDGDNGSDAGTGRPNA